MLVYLTFLLTEIRRTSPRLACCTGVDSRIVEEFRRDVRILALRADVVVLGEPVEPLASGRERKDGEVRQSVRVPELPDEPVALQHHRGPAGQEQIEGLQLVDAHEGLQDVLRRPVVELLEGLGRAGSSAQLTFIAISASCFSGAAPARGFRPSGA